MPQKHQEFSETDPLLGAGFANAAQNKAGWPTPSGRQLSERILTLLRIEGSAPLGMAIDKLREKRSPQEGFQFLSDQLNVPKIQDEQIAILELPWFRIYTTNVDNIGTAHSKRKCHNATEEKSLLGRGDYVYLHGCITDCTPTNFGQKLKLGEQMYMANSFSSSGYNYDLRKDLFSADAVVVIGYSMADPNYQDIFYSSEDIVNKCFVVSGIPD